MVSTGDPRTLHAFKKARQALRAQRLPCWLCGGEIDYAATGPAVNKNPWSFVADHVMPVAKGGAPFDPANLRPAHRLCNGRKSDKTHVKRRDNSRRW